MIFIYKSWKLDTPQISFSCGTFMMWYYRVHRKYWEYNYWWHNLEESQVCQAGEGQGKTFSKGSVRLQFCAIPRMMDIERWEDLSYCQGWCSYEIKYVINVPGIKSKDTHPIEQKWKLSYSELYLFCSACVFITSYHTWGNSH